MKETTNYIRWIHVYQNKCVEYVRQVDIDNSDMSLVTSMHAHIIFSKNWMLNEPDTVTFPEDIS